MTTQEKLKENENDHNHFRNQRNRPKLGRVCKRCGMGMDILELAREIGAVTPASLYGRTDYIVMTVYELKRFADLVAAAERKACAALCSEVAAGKDAEAIEEAILARGEK